MNLQPTLHKAIKHTLSEVGFKCKITDLKK